MTTGRTAAYDADGRDDVARLENTVRRLWYDLAMAERRGQSRRVLERMYNAYVAAVDELVRRQHELARERPRTRQRDRLAS